MIGGRPLQSVLVESSDIAMKPTQWLLSALFVAFIVLKVWEGVLQVESWPLTHNPMFSKRMPPEVLPWRITLRGTRGGPWFELRAYDFNLSEDELNRRLLTSSSFTELAVRCGELGRLHNERRPGPKRLTELRMRAEEIPRPGVPARPFNRTLACPLGGPR